jgi:putative membrane protein
MTYFFVAIAGIIHVYIFTMESLLWGTAKVNRAFGMSDELAKKNRLFAFNQGYYNLFLAAAAFLGIVLSLTRHDDIGTTLMAYSCASMLGASLVLLYSQRRLIRPALIQGLPPLLALVSWMISHG